MIRYRPMLLARPRGPVRAAGGSLFLRLVLSASVALVASPGATAVADTESRPRAGDKAPPFELKAVETGQPVTLDGLVRGATSRGVVLVFLSCRCPYVAQARQPLAELVKQYGGKVAFVGVNANQNEPADEIKADAARNFQFPVLRDEASRTAALYGADRTPEVFLIDGKGVIRYHGGVADLNAALGDFTAGRAVAKSEAKAFGCTIKRKPAR